MDGLHHDLQRRINQCARCFRIKPFDQGRRTFEVSEECSDDLALIPKEILHGKPGLFIRDAFVTAGCGCEGRGTYGRSNDRGVYVQWWRPSERCPTSSTKAISRIV